MDLKSTVKLLVISMGLMWKEIGLEWRLEKMMMENEKETL
jgi:hypothetical protein